MTTKNWWQKYAGTAVVVALITLVSAALSAYITHTLTKSTMLETQRLEFKKQAYADFLTAQTLNLEAAAKQQEANQVADAVKKKTLLDEASTKAAESRKVFDGAKLRILLLGSDKVLCSMAEYWATRDKFPDCTDVAEKGKDAAIYRNMRRDFFQTLGAKESPELDDRIIVPFLRSCVLPGEPKIDQVCKGL